MKPRHHLYLDEELTARLDMLASTPGTSKSAIISDALREYLNRRATREVDDLLKHRLDRISNQLGRIERDGAYANLALRAALDRSELDRRDRAFVTEPPNRLVLG